MNRVNRNVEYPTLTAEMDRQYKDKLNFKHNYKGLKIIGYICLALADLVGLGMVIVFGYVMYLVTTKL